MILSLPEGRSYACSRDGEAGFTLMFEFVNYWMRIVSHDFGRLTYAGYLENLSESLDSPRHKFVRGDVCDGPLLLEVMDEVDGKVFHQRESHADRRLRRISRS